MTTYRRGVLALALAFAGLTSCREPSPVSSLLPLGTRVPISDLTPWRDDLRAFVVREIDEGRDASAYFVLDLLKTRPYAELKLARQHVAEGLRDLRPMVDALLAADNPRRGLRIVRHSGPRRRKHPENEVYWRHIAQFEKRVAILNEKTPGIPYSYAAQKSYGVSSAEETGVLLSDDEALLNVLIHGERTYGFVVVGDKLVVRPLTWPSDRLRHVVRRFLDRIDEPPSSESLASWTADAAALHDAIIGPFAKELGDPRLHTLLVSPDDVLANLPFSVLLEPTPTGRRALVERLRVTYVPSISVFRQLLARPIFNQAPRVLAVANALYPTGVPKLPFAEREAASVAELFPNATLLVGAAAREERIVALSPQHNVLHFATHGLLLGALSQARRACS